MFVATMSGIDKLLTLARTYAEAEGIELSTVSSRVFDDSKKLTALEQGADIQVRRFESAVVWFDQHWPQSAAWPNEISRPTTTQAAE